MAGLLAASGRPSGGKTTEAASRPDATMSARAHISSLERRILDFPLDAETTNAATGWAGSLGRDGRGGSQQRRRLGIIGTATSSWRGTEV